MAAATTTKTVEKKQQKNERQVSYYDGNGKPSNGQHRFVKVVRADDTEQIVEQVYRGKKGKWIKYTPKGTLDKRAIILAVKEEYANFNKEGVYKIQVRNMHYKLMERPELKLGEVADPYTTLDKIIIAGRRHEVKLRKGEKGPKDKYYIPDEWWNDLKRHNPQPRPSRTPHQHAKWIMEFHVKGWVDQYPQPIWFRQDKYWIEIWVEKDTMIGLLEQLVANVFGLWNAIPVNSVSGFDSRSHAIRQIKRLLKHKRRGRKIVIFYLGDYDPSGLKIQENVEKNMQELGLVKGVDYEIRRVGITLDQIKRLHLKEVTDPAKLDALANDNNGPAFEKMPGHNGRRFAIEVDSMSSGPGLKELKKIIGGIKDEFWDEEIWNKYKDVFTSEKVHQRVIAEFVPFAREIVDKSDDPDQTIEEWAQTLSSEWDELAAIEGPENVRPLLDPWDDDAYDDEDGDG
jgi:hypothetical protein